VPNIRTPQTDACFAAFRAAHGIADTEYDVARFGWTEALTDELNELVFIGRKRATCCLMQQIEIGKEGMARVGGYVVMLDSRDRPAAIWRTTDVTVKPMNQVDDAFAWDEGEGDRTRADWLRAHISFYSALAGRDGFAFDPGMMAVFERFTIVWPPAIADAGHAES
jgi:uncharacterized protein YhfF